MSINNVTSTKLRQFIERIEKLEEERQFISTSISEVYSEAKSDGFDPKAMKQVIKMRKMSDDKLREMEMLIQTYMDALEN